MILIAEDDKNFGFVLKSELEAERYVVDLVADGVEAILRFIDKKYDFLLFDIKMPKLDGINALRIIKKIAPNIPAILFSGTADSEVISRAADAGAVLCLTKPFEIAKLKDAIRQYSSSEATIKLEEMGA